jgi:hypothetical protein
MVNGERNFVWDGLSAKETNQALILRPTMGVAYIKGERICHTSECTELRFSEDGEGEQIPTHSPSVNATW